MRISLFCIGKTNQSFVNEGFDFFKNRLQRYCKFELVCLPDVKNAAKLSPDALKKKEAEAFLKVLPKSFFILDEHGKQYRSLGFARFIEKEALAGNSHIALVIGGAFGFDDELREKCRARISLSNMTFTHQFIRLMLIEQLYRAFSILKNEPYHNE